MEKLDRSGKYSHSVHNGEPSHRSPYPLISHPDLSDFGLLGCSSEDQCLVRKTIHGYLLASCLQDPTLNSAIQDNQPFQSCIPHYQQSDAPILSPLVDPNFTHVLIFTPGPSTPFLESPAPHPSLSRHQQNMDQFTHLPFCNRRTSVTLRRKPIPIHLKSLNGADTQEEEMKCEGVEKMDGLFLVLSRMSVVPEAA